MNERIILETAVAKNPRDRVVAMMLVDWLREYTSLTYFGALRVVCAIRRINRRASEMAEAAQLLSANSRYRMVLRGAVIGETGAEFEDDYTLFILPGFGPPSARQEYRSNPGAFWYANVVTVGARWLIARHARMEENDAYVLHLRRQALGVV